MKKLYSHHLSKQHEFLNSHIFPRLRFELENKLQEKRSTFKTRLKEKEISTLYNQNNGDLVEKDVTLAKKDKTVAFLGPPAQRANLICNTVYRIKHRYKQGKNLFPVIVRSRLRGMRHSAFKRGVIGENLYKKKRDISQKPGKNFLKNRVVLLSSSKYKENVEKRKTNKNSKNNATIIHVLGTYNNTIYTFSPSPGKTGFCLSTGMCGFKNSRKSTSYASQKAAEKLSTLAKRYTNVRIKMQGLGPGKLGGVRTLYKSGLKISNIQECTASPHNGCRPSKRRRL